MSDNVWDRREGEPNNWYSRFLLFRDMGPTRSLLGAVNAEREKKREKKITYLSQSWSDACSAWRWKERAEAYDAYEQQKQEKLLEAERQKILSQRFALMHKRVEALDLLAQQLIEYAGDEGRVWLPDVKSVGTGPGAERVDLVQFNDGLFKEIREYLTDLAEEMGGRTKKTETTLKSIPKLYIDLDPDEDGSEE